MFKLIRNHLIYFVPYLLLLIGAIYLMFHYDKGQIHMFINQYHSPFWDQFFTYYTHVGDDILLISVNVFLFFISYRLAFALGATNALASIVVQFLKRVPFDDLPRPMLYFTDFYTGAYKLYLVPGVDVSIWYPFPSGHTKAAFILSLFLVLMMSSKFKPALNYVVQFVAIVLACLVAYSRMYLSQHFLMDTVGGSLVGIVFTLVCFYVFMKLNATWLDGNLIQTYRKKKERNSL